ncbi:hypothetical protein CONLIGDRAFT_686919 [Coniochaeta ligniaria NRRL 30616]|uniref:Uncharacterized protein n=1 Tax=Coniochaeta ligniaria NRRL 30616 TaxID=1408157 RepID=A0A1J7IPW8_9PEZI|nr:hypothetical protein CONLIGDRAFT_686919 [Coniochaeta ligniaria NRRL 30616]
MWSIVNSPGTWNNLFMTSCLPKGPNPLTLGTKAKGFALMIRVKVLDQESKSTDDPVVELLAEGVHSIWRPGDPYDNELNPPQRKALLLRLLCGGFSLSGTAIYLVQVIVMHNPKTKRENDFQEYIEAASRYDQRTAGNTGPSFNSSSPLNLLTGGGRSPHHVSSCLFRRGSSTLEVLV